MKFYLASRYDRKLELRDIRFMLEAQYHTVVSSWLDEEEPLDIQIEDVEPNTLTQYALYDVRDIRQCEIFVHFQNRNQPNIRGGALVEFGIAYAQGKQMIVVGDKTNIFDFVPTALHFATVEEFLTWTRDIR